MPSLTIEQIKTNLEADKRWRERRHQAWTEIYELFRNTVITNRLTQRQSVNVPLMKATIRTILSRASDPADLEFEDYDNDGMREIVMNAYVDKVLEDNKYELLDIVDKKNVGLYGRGSTKLNIVDGMPKITVHDPFDVLFDRYTLPWDIDTARRITHLGIFRSIADIEQNPLYDATAIAALKEYFASRKGLVKAGVNEQLMVERAQRMLEMGVPDALSPALGETYVELVEIQQKVWDEAKKEDVIHVIVVAEGAHILMDKPLQDILNVNFFTWTSWTDDPEATDVYSDGTGDIVLTPNKVLNVYFSQMVESEVLRGYGMNFYNSALPGQEGWSPLGYVPAPWGFYPVPGDPNTVIKHIDIPQSDSRMSEMDLITKMVESATAASAIEKGDTPEGAQTLGEISLMAAKADERMKDVPKFARIHAKQLGKKLADLIVANTDKLKPVTLYKKSAGGTYWEKTIKPSDLKAKKGYNCVVTLKAEKEADSLKEIQKLKIGASQFPMNVPLQRILSDRMLSWLELSPDEKKEVQDYETQNPGSLLPQMPGAPGAGGPTPPAGPMLPQMSLPAPVNQPMPTHA